MCLEVAGVGRLTFLNLANVGGRLRRSQRWLQKYRQYWRKREAGGCRIQHITFEYAASSEERF